MIAGLLDYLYCFVCSHIIVLNSPQIVLMHHICIPFKSGKSPGAGQPLIISVKRFVVYATTQYYCLVMHSLCGHYHLSVKFPSFKVFLTLVLKSIVTQISCSKIKFFLTGKNCSGYWLWDRHSVYVRC